MNMFERRNTRRTFIKQVAAGLAAGAAVARPSLLRAQSPNGKISHASIGVGGMGWTDVRQIGSSPHVHITAICDVDTARMANAAKQFPDARKYQHWRELLETEGDKIDSVNVSTPDHTHAVVTLSALARGKHVYCQKPLTHDIDEARRVAAAAAKADVVTQMGTQWASGVGDLQLVHYLQSGVIGKIKRVWLWSNKDIRNYRPFGPRPEGADPIPASLDWDAWLGTAPERPYKKGIYHPTWWRGWQDFGCGWLGDMGCHIFDAPYRGLGLTYPLSIKATVEPQWKNHPQRRVETYPRWQIVDYVFPGTEYTAGDTLELTWYDGYKYPPDELRQHFGGAEWPTQGALILGEKGAILKLHGGESQLHPREQFEGHPQPDLEPRHHWHDWASSCVTGEPTRSPFDYAARATEIVLMGTIALRFPDETLNWDAPNMTFTNQPEANRYVKRIYRAGWAMDD